MATQPVRWLYEELPKLVQGGVLDQASADRLQKHYGTALASPWKTGATVLIGALGVLGVRYEVPCGSDAGLGRHDLLAVPRFLAQRRVADPRAVWSVLL